MSRLEIRLFGGFDVQHDGRSVEGFETRKTSALFVYLLVNADRPHTREHLAGLLWSESDDSSSRRSLRQALYNLRATFQKAGFDGETILSSHQSVRFNKDVDHWFDLEAFQSSLARARAAGGTARAHHLAGAVELYSGDFMKGFSLRDSPEFEEWLLARTELYRTSALEALQALVDHCIVHREYRLGIRYARRLLELDPFSEAAHRTLIRLYFLSGQQSEALGQYETCRELLAQELGVEPSSETVGLYRSVLAKESVEEAGTLEMDTFPSRPLIPIVGRQKELAELHHQWKQAASGNGRLVIVEGELGIGKTALVERAIRQLTGSSPPLVLRAECAPFAAVSGYEPVTEALRRSIFDHPLHIQNVLGQLSSTEVAELARLLPELKGLRPDLPPAPSSESGSRGRLLKSLAQFLRTLVQSWATAEPIVLFLDDVHRADPYSVDLLGQLVRDLSQAPIFFVATREVAARDLGGGKAGGEDGLVVRIPLGRLEPSEVRQIASALIQKQNRERLTAFFEAYGGNLPLLLRELTDLLFEQGVLVSSGPFDWDLVGPLPELPTEEAELLGEIARRRLDRLPTSARRLLTLAAVVGERFNGELLGIAANEQAEVVQATIHTWIERGMVHPSSEHEPLRRKEAQGLELSSLNGRSPAGPAAALLKDYEFVSPSLRDAIYESVRPERRRVMHGQIATALEQLYALDQFSVLEALAYHFTTGHEWSKALEYLDRCMHQGQPAVSTARLLRHGTTALEILDRLERSLEEISRQQSPQDETAEDVIAERRLWRSWVARRPELETLRGRLAAELAAICATD